MYKLKTLSLDFWSEMFTGEKFMMNFRTTFPALENFAYAGHPIAISYVWDINVISRIMKFLGKMKRMSISSLCLIVFETLEDSEREIVSEKRSLEIFNKAFKIIKKKFPKKTTEIELYDQNYGFWIKKEKDQLPVKYIPPKTTCNCPKKSNRSRRTATLQSRLIDDFAVMQPLHKV